MPTLLRSRPSEKRRGVVVSFFSALDEVWYMQRSYRRCPMPGIDLLASLRMWAVKLPHQGGLSDLGEWVLSSTFDVVCSEQLPPKWRSWKQCDRTDRHGA